MDRRNNAVSDQEVVSVERDGHAGGQAEQVCGKEDRPDDVGGEADRPPIRTTGRFSSVNERVLRHDGFVSERHQKKSRTRSTSSCCRNSASTRAPASAPPDL